MSSWAKPGVKCVCIKKGEWEIRTGHHLGLPLICPDFGEICTISIVSTASDGWVFIGLESFGARRVFCVEQFRPLVVSSEEQDVALFEHHLAKASQDA